MEQRLLDFLPKLYDPARLETDYPEILQEVAELCGANSATLQLLEGDHAPQVHLAMVSAGPIPGVERLPEYMERHSAAENEVWARVACNRRDITTDLELFGSLEATLNRAEVKALREMFGIEQRAGLRIKDVKAWEGLLGLQYNTRDARRFEQTRAVMPLLYPHLTASLEISRRFSVLQKSALQMEATLDALKIPILVFDESRRLCFKNVAADEVFEEQGQFGLGRDGIEIRAARDHARLQAEIGAALATACARPAAAPRHVALEDGSYLFIIRPFADAARRFGPAAGFFVEIIRANARAELSAKFFDVLFNLTVTETDVANRLLRGQRSDEISEEREVAVATTRGQIKQILSKTESRGQVDLVRLAAAVNPPFR